MGASGAHRVHDAGGRQADQVPDMGASEAHRVPDADHA